MTTEKKKLSAFAAFILALLAAWGIYNPKPDPSPTPTPTATAAPSILPTPEPIPTPTTSPTKLPIPPCNLPPHSNNNCAYNPPRPAFQAIVQQAQDALGVTWAADPGAYTDSLAQLLRQWGYCAQPGRGIPDEVWIKNTNEFSEHYDLVTANGDIWTHFAARCAPPGF